MITFLTTHFRSVPVIIRQLDLVPCTECEATFRFNFTLRRHMIKVRKCPQISCLNILCEEISLEVSNFPGSWQSVLRAGRPSQVPLPTLLLLHVQGIFSKDAPVPRPPKSSTPLRVPPVQTAVPKQGERGET